MAAEKKIDADVLVAIDRGSWVADGLGFAMSQMDPKLYVKVKKVLEALVAVMSVGFTFRSDNKTLAFRGWLESLPNAKWERLPSDAFKDSGTVVHTVLMTIRKD